GDIKGGPDGVTADASGNFKTANGVTGSGSITDANGKVSGSGTATYTGANGSVTGDIKGGPDGVTADASGNFKTANGVTGSGSITDATGKVSGTGTATYTGANGSVTGDIKGGPDGVTADASGTFKTANGVTGTGSITDANGKVSGSGTATYTGANGSVTGDIKDGPTGVTADASGTLKAANGLSGTATVTDANGKVSGSGDVTYTGKDGSIKGDVSGGASGITAGVTGTIKKGDVTGSGSITDTNGALSGSGDVTYTGKDGSIKGDVSGGASGVSAGVTGTIKKGNVTADASVNDTNGAVSGSGDVTYTGKDGSVTGKVTGGATGVAGSVTGTITKGAVTAQGGVTGSTTTGVNANGSVDVKGEKNGVQYEAGAEGQAGTSGISADVYGKVGKDLGNGKTVAAAGLGEFNNGVADGGGAVGFTDQGKFGVQAGALVGTDGVTAGVQVEIKDFTIGVVTKDLQLEHITVSLGPKHKLLNKILDIAGDVVVAAVSPVGFTIGEIEKIATRGKPAGIDKLFHLVGGPDANATVTDNADHNTDSKARAAIANSAAILTTDDLNALSAMRMMTPQGQIDVSASPALFQQRLNDSPLSADQKQALLTAYNALGKNTKHANVNNQSGVSAIYTLLQSGNRDPQPFADLLEQHPNDMSPMVQEIVIAPGYGLAFANVVVHAAGIIDSAAVRPDGTVYFAPPPAMPAASATSAAPAA
ncbi:MAG TPA: hypothetical protein VH165_12980, partial [Kofleriaceae bacterium]|nr:hypothetical protein [Kofleriaceae bacterium]